MLSHPDTSNGFLVCEQYRRRRRGLRLAAGGHYRGGAPPACHHLPKRPASTNVLRMSFYSIPFAPERVEATEARLEAIYEAARYGLKGDSLAIRVGLTPAQYRRLAEFDPLVEMAEMKGRADGEFNAGQTLYQAAATGDAKAALEILKHQHGWKAAQSVEITVEGEISITAALEKAKVRVIEGFYTEAEDAPTSSSLLTDQQRRLVDGYRYDNARTPAKSTDV